MSSQGNLSTDDLGSKRSLGTKKVVKKVIKKKTPGNDEEVDASQVLGSKTGSINNLAGSKIGSRNKLGGSKLVSKNNLKDPSADNIADIEDNKNEVTDSNIISYKVGQVSTMTADDIEKILGDKERLLGELYTAEVEIDRLEEENQKLKNTIEEQKKTISKLLISNNENGITIDPENDDNENNVTVISSNYEDVDKGKLIKKIEALEVSNEHLKGQNEELLGVIQNSEEEIERLETELRSVKSSSKVELTKTKIENNKLKSSIEELENKVESISSLEKENEMLKSSLETLEHKNESLVNNSMENIEDKDRIIDNLQNDNQELKLSLESVKDEITKINQKDKEIELLQRENDIIRRENEELILANNELQATINELTGNVKQNDDLTQDDIKIISTDQNSRLSSHPFVNSNAKEIDPSSKGDIADTNSIKGKDFSSVCSSSISLLKCSVPELVKEIKDLKKCVYYINKQKKDLEKKLQDITNNKEQKNNPNQNENEIINGQNNTCDMNNKNEPFTLQELQGIIEGMDKEIINTRRIKAQFDEQENSIIDLKRELLKYSRNKEERVRNIGRALNTDFMMGNPNNNNNNINYNNINPDAGKSYPKIKNERNKINTNGDNDMADNIYFKVQLQSDKTKLQSQLSNAKKAIHQLKKLCDGLSNELENYRSNNEKDNSTDRQRCVSQSRNYDKRSSSLGRNFGLTSNSSSNPKNYYISINDNAPSSSSGSNGNTSISGSSLLSKNTNSAYDSVSSHGYADNSSLFSGTSFTSSIPKDKYGHNRRSKSTSRYPSKYSDNNNTDIMMLINERDKEREHRLNRDLNSLQNKFQDLLKSYQSIKNERDVMSNELNSSPYNASNKQEHHHHSRSHHRKPSDNFDTTITRGRSQSPSKRKSEKDNASNGHLRSCSTHTNGIKVEVYT